MASEMMLNDYMVPSNRLSVSVVTSFDSTKLGGETSATDSAHKGIKPKEVSVSFVLPFERERDLSLFYGVAQALDDNGELIVYDITERSSNSAKVKKVTFTNRIDQREVTDKNAWMVSFTLIERLSMAERTEQRTTLIETEAPETQGSDISSPELSQETEVSSFEAALARFDKTLA